MSVSRGPLKSPISRKRDIGAPSPNLRLSVLNLIEEQPVHPCVGRPDFVARAEAAEFGSDREAWVTSPDFSVSGVVTRSEQSSWTPTKAM
jgi:hypothetical protein